jgi:hypothetical protein
MQLLRLLVALAKLVQTQALVQLLAIHGAMHQRPQL